MKYLKTPNLPEKTVGMVITDGRINEKIEKGFSNLGINAVKTGAHDNLYHAVAYHPDMMLCHAGNKSIVFAPGTPEKILDNLKALGFEMIQGITKLKPEYPWNVAYNTAVAGNKAFLNIKYTDVILINILKKAGIKLIDIRQGYAKCSISIVDNCSIITADKGIAKEAVKENIEVLLIEPETSIKLPGLKYGFIGGCSGLIDKDKWIIAGDYCRLRAAKEIKDFITSRRKNIISLYDGDVIDIGSILPVLYK